MGMHFLDYFSDDYEVARQKFLDTVKAYGLEHHAFTNPQTGPEGQILATDVAWYGNKAAEKVLVFISGTHGVEFLAGSGCQIGWIKEGHLAEFREQRGEAAFQAGIFGQYTHDNGFYFGGRQPVWSNRILKEIIDSYCQQCKKLAVMDIHSGLGPFGYGLIGVAAEPKSSTAQRARRWYGKSMTTFAEVGDQAGYVDYSELVNGMLMHAFVQTLPDVEVTPAGVEFGTYPLKRVFEAERADAWLHNNPDANSELAEQIREELLRVYFPNTPDWLEMVWRRSEQITRQTLDGLAGVTRD